MPWKEITLQAKSTLTSINLRMKLTPLPEPRADNSTRMTRLSEPKCSHGLARRVTLLSKKGNPAKWVTLMAKPTFVSRVDGLPSFVRIYNEKLSCPGYLG